MLLRQRYLKNKLQLGLFSYFGELKLVHMEIENWYIKESEKLQHQARVREFQESERSTIYHHEIHKRTIKKASILRLETSEGIIDGHNSCAAYLESTVHDLLGHPAVLEPGAQQALLAEVTPVFTENDNNILLTPPSDKAVLETVNRSNVNAAPGTDGLPSLLYKECWDTLGGSLSEVVRCIFTGQKPPKSMETSVMVFGAKPKKPFSILPGDKRKISLLNADFKICTGLEAKLLKDTATHTLSHLQLVAGSDRRVHHGINMARDAILAAGKPGHTGCGILDTDLVAAFDYMCMEWVYKVLDKKGLDKRVIDRFRNLYSDSKTIVMVNNIPGKMIENTRQSLRQGDLPSMHFFSFGIDPLLVYLEKRLEGILIASLPVQGPVQQGQDDLGPMEERYRALGYADDVKPAICSMQEFLLVDRAMALFEKASGCRLHRNPASRKCKFLPLARWRGTLQQEDIPCQYMTISDHLDMLGVELRATWTQTRKANGDICQERVEKTIRQWKSGKFMHFSLRSWSLNQYCLPKVWFKTHSIDLRVQDVSKISSHVKSWLYQDMLLKPEELIMHRHPSLGGLGVHNVQLNAQAALTRTFLETAANPIFRKNLYHNMLYRYHILDDSSVPNPGFPPYYSQDFFSRVRKVHEESPLNILRMTEKDWYRVLLEDYCTQEKDNNTGERVNIMCRVEKANPQTDWEQSWRLARLPGLGPENTSFLLRMMHDLLPTQERVARTNPRAGAGCQVQGCAAESDDRAHALVHCLGNTGVGQRVVRCLQSYNPNIDVKAVLRLEISVDEGLELPLVWLVATTFSSLWKLRVEKTRATLFEIRSQLEAKINLLRETRFSNTATILDELVTNYFY